MPAYARGGRGEIMKDHVSIFRDRWCFDCGLVPCSLMKTIKASGVFKVHWVCFRCNRKAFGDSALIYCEIPHNLLEQNKIDINKLPVYKDCRTDICEVCGNLGVEIHHWAPHAIFSNNQDWPVSNLCRKCHSEWHRKVTPDMCQK